MMRPSRLEAIRSGATSPVVKELIEEIDRLRAEVKELELSRDGWMHSSNVYHSKLHASEEALKNNKHGM